LKKRLLLYLQELLDLQTHGGCGERDHGQAGHRDESPEIKLKELKFVVKLIASDDSTILKR
jgi:hypothetical protein